MKIEVICLAAAVTLCIIMIVFAGIYIKTNKNSQEENISKKESKTDPDSNAEKDTNKVPPSKTETPSSETSTSTEENNESNTKKLENIESDLEKIKFYYKIIKKSLKEALQSNFKSDDDRRNTITLFKSIYDLITPQPNKLIPTQTKKISVLEYLKRIYEYLWNWGYSFNHSDHMI